MPPPIEPSPRGAGGGGVNRERIDSPPALNCEGQAKALKDKYRAVLDATNQLKNEGKVAVDGLSFRVEEPVRSRKVKELEEKANAIRREWSRLKFKCPLIGTFEPEKPDLPPESDDFKTPAGRANLRHHALQLQYDAARMRDYGRLGEAIGAAHPAISVEGSVILASAGLEFDPYGFAAALGTAIWERRADLLDLAAQGLRDLIEDPPSPDYTNVVVPSIQPLPATANKKPLQKLTGESAEAQRWSNAYIQAYTTSFERYQGAKASGDAPAMARQSRAMIEFALDSQQKGREATLKWYEVEQLVDKALQAAEAELAKKGIRWQEAFLEWQRKLAADGLSPESRAAMIAAGIPEKEIDSRHKRLLAVTFKEIEEGFADQRGTLKIDESIRASLTKSGSKATWPEPPHVPALEMMEYHARHLYRQVTETRIELSWTGMKEGVKKEDAEEEDRQYWWVVPAGKPPRLHEDTLINWKDSGPMMPGKYDVYVMQGEKNPARPIPATVCLARGVQVEEGKPAKVLLQTGLQVTPAEGFPKPHAWFVLSADAPATGILAQRTGGSLEPLWLLPGKYDVYWVQSASQLKRPMLLARGVEVKENQLATVPIGLSGIKLELADWIPPRDKGHGWWGAVHAGDSPEYVVQRTATEDKLLLLPGKYDVYWTQDHGHQGTPLLLAAGVEVKEGVLSTAAAKSGLELETADWVPKRDKDYGWWGVVRTGDPPKNRLHWSSSDDKLVLPPGQYDVYWVQDHAHRDWPLLLAKGVTVKNNLLAKVAAKSGVQLEVADWVPLRDAGYGWWGVALAGLGPQHVVNWAAAGDKLLVPPGTYDLYWGQDLNHENSPVLLAKAVKVKENQTAVASAKSGVKLKLPANAPALDADYGWWGLVPPGGGPEDRIHWSVGRFDQPLLVPPGTYDIVWRQNYEHKPETVKKGVVVKENGLLEVEVQPPKVALPR